MTAIHFWKNLTKVLILSLPIVSVGCRTMNVNQAIDPSSISIVLSPSGGKYMLRYTLVNRNDFPIAVLKSHVPSRNGELTDNAFTFAPPGPVFTGIIPFNEWSGDESVELIEPSGEYGMLIRLDDFYAKLNGARSVYIDHLMQVARIRDGREIDMAHFELVRVRSNVMLLH